MKYTYIPTGVCSRRIDIELDGDIVKKVDFLGGCAGNAAGISKLIEGMKAQDVISKLRGTRCGSRSTSCPDQLSIALEEALKQM